MEILGKTMRSERVRVALLALIATYAFFYEYLPPFKTVYLYSDIAGYHYPLQRYAFQALKEGRIPQWDSSIYCGISFIGSVQVPSRMARFPAVLYVAARQNREPGERARSRGFRVHGLHGVPVLAHGR